MTQTNEDALMNQLCQDVRRFTIYNHFNSLYIACSGYYVPSIRVTPADDKETAAAKRRVTAALQARGIAVFTG